MELPLSPIRVVPVKNWCQPFGIEADVLRLDELHPLVSGNKWFKLAPWLERARSEGSAGLITFGGAWSNHLLATAEACRLSGLRAIGIVRGERPVHPSLLLQDAARSGMELHFTSRPEYREGIIPDHLLPLLANHRFLVVPEGGYSAEGCAGAARIAAMLAGAASNPQRADRPEDNPAWSGYTHILCAVGTGTTLAGLSSAALPGQQCIGISVLKNNHSLDAAVRALLPREAQQKFQVVPDFHHGGYARHKPALIAFMNDWYQSTGIPSDFVYTGKLFYAAQQLVERGFFPAASRLLLVHSGGLQGNRSLPAGTLMF